MQITMIKMSLVWLTLFAIVSAVSAQNDPSCGLHAPDYNGSHWWANVYSTRPHSFPFLASIGYLENEEGAIESDNPTNYTHFCTGSIIDRQWVLTSGNCAGDLPAGKRHVIVVGAYNISSNAVEESKQTVGIEKVVLHPLSRDFNQNGTIQGWASENNIALIKLARPLELDPDETVRIICVPPQSQIGYSFLNSGQTGIRLVTAGWGPNNLRDHWMFKVSELNKSEVEELRSDHFDEVVKMAIIDVPSSEWAKLHYGITDRRVDKMIITDKLPGGGQGGGRVMASSGRPLIELMDDGRWAVVGVASWIINTDDYPCAWAIVAVFSDWIFAAIRKDKEEGTLVVKNATLISNSNEPDKTTIRMVEPSTTIANFTTLNPYTVS